MKEENQSYEKNEHVFLSASLILPTSLSVQSLQINWSECNRAELQRKYLVRLSSGTVLSLQNLHIIWCYLIQLDVFFELTECKRLNLWCFDNSKKWCWKSRKCSEICFVYFVKVTNNSSDCALIIICKKITNLFKYKR